MRLRHFSKKKLNCGFDICRKKTKNFIYDKIFFCFTENNSQCIIFMKFDVPSDTNTNNQIFSPKRLRRFHDTLLSKKKSTSSFT